MGTRGRKSAADLAVIGPTGIETIHRPDPLPELTDEQAQEWRGVVNRLAADWFPRETHGMLAQYCRHIVSARRIAALISSLETKEEFDSQEYDKLLKMQERESRCISSLATRMRMTQQATYDPERRKPKQGTPPWQVEG